MAGAPLLPGRAFQPQHLSRPLHFQPISLPGITLPPKPTDVNFRGTILNLTEETTWLGWCSVFRMLQGPNCRFLASVEVHDYARGWI